MLTINLLFLLHEQERVEVDVAVEVDVRSKITSRPGGDKDSNKAATTRITRHRDAAERSQRSSGGATKGRAKEEGGHQRRFAIVSKESMAARSDLSARA